MGYLPAGMGYIITRRVSIQGYRPTMIPSVECVGLWHAKRRRGTRKRHSNQGPEILCSIDLAIRMVMDSVWKIRVQSLATCISI